MVSANHSKTWPKSGERTGPRARGRSTLNSSTTGTRGSTEPSGRVGRLRRCGRPGGKRPGGAPTKAPPAVESV